MRLKNIISICFILVLLLLPLYFSIQYFRGALVNHKSNLEKISLRLVWEYQSQFVGYIAAKEKGFYENEGLDVVINEGHAEGNLVSLVAAGVDTFGVSQLEDIIMNVDNGREVRAIAQIFQHNNQIILAKKSSGIVRLADFKNKTYSTWSGANDLMLRILLLKEKINTPNIKILPFQYWNVEDFLSDTAQLIKVMKYNEYHRILQRGIDPIDLNIFSFGDYGLDIPEDVIYTSKMMIEKRPDLCIKFVRATLRGWDYALSHKGEMLNILNKYVKNLDRDHEEYMMDIIFKNVTPTEAHSIGSFDKGRIAAFLSLLHSNRQLQNKLTIESIVDASILNRINN